MNQFNDAIAAFQYGIGVAPDSDNLYLNLARLYVRLQNGTKLATRFNGCWNANRISGCHPVLRQLDGLPEEFKWTRESNRRDAEAQR
jgi:hypothetical protein